MSGSAVGAKSQASSLFQCWKNYAPIYQIKIDSWGQFGGLGLLHGQFKDVQSEKFQLAVVDVRKKTREIHKYPNLTTMAKKRR